MCGLLHLTYLMTPGLGLRWSDDWSVSGTLDPDLGFVDCAELRFRCLSWCSGYRQMDIDGKGRSEMARSTD